MSVTAAVLIDSKYASNTDNTEYTSAALTTTLIDKFTATNTDTGAATLTVNIVKSGQSAGGSNTVISAYSIAAGATYDVSELKNHILGAGDYISVKSGTASKVVIRASGRKVT